MAVIAAQHALSPDPTYSFAELIIELTQSGITPADAGHELHLAAPEALAFLRLS